jgi:hypothetical protein
VREPVRDQGVETFEIEKRLDIALARRVAVAHRGQIGAERAAQLGVGVEDLAEGLGDQPGIDIGVVEALRQAVAHGILEAVLAEDGGVEEASERRLGAHGLICLAAQLRPEGVDGGESRDLGTLGCTSHVCLRD